MILSVFEHYLSIHCLFFEKGFKREKLEKSKEVTLWLKVFGEGSLELRNIYKHFE